MDVELKKAIQAGIDKLRQELSESVKQHQAQIADAGSAAAEVKSSISGLSEKFSQLTQRLAELEQKGIKLNPAESTGTIGQQFVATEAFKSLQANRSNRSFSAAAEIKNTVTAEDGATTWSQRNPGIIPGNFLPLTVRRLLPAIPTSANMINSLREASWTNSAAEVSQATAKPESDITFEPYDVAVRTVAHWIKVSNQLLADAPSIAAYIDGRLRDGLAQRVDRQLILGNGTSPNISGLTDSGNYTAYTPTSDDNLVEAINRAKYLMWATGNIPDTVIVNPADWGEMERMREGSGTGAYLYGLPGMFAGMNPFGVAVALSSHITAGKFIIGSLRSSTSLYERQSVAVEVGYINDDFTKNLVTIRAEERLGLGVERPAGIYYGDFTA